MESVEAYSADGVFDGGDMDCGSGLILLIRENISQVPVGGILEMRSQEPSVASDLPPWCRMVGHDYLGSSEADGYSRYFIRRGETNDVQQLEEDKKKAREYQWRLRARHSAHLSASIYSRNFSFQVGQAASFEEKDQSPCAIEYLLGALAGALTTAFATNCSRQKLEVDDIEISMSGELKNILAHLGLEDGDPGLKKIELKCFASTFEDEDRVRTIWQESLDRCPLMATLSKAVEIKTLLVIV